MTVETRLLEVPLPELTVSYTDNLFQLIVDSSPNIISSTQGPRIDNSNNSFIIPFIYPATTLTSEEVQRVIDLINNYTISYSDITLTSLPNLNVDMNDISYNIVDDVASSTLVIRTPFSKFQPNVSSLNSLFMFIETYIPSEWTIVGAEEGGTVYIQREILGT